MILHKTHINNVVNHITTYVLITVYTFGSDVFSYDKLIKNIKNFIIN